MVKKLSIFLWILTAFVLVTLCGCGTDTPSEPGTPPESETEALTFIVVDAEGNSEFTLVRPDGETSDSPVVKYAASLYQSLSRKAAHPIVLKTDFDGREDNSARAEILLGLTNRPLSRKAAEELGKNQFHMLREGNKIALVGGSDSAFVQGVQAFLARYLNETGTGPVLALPEILDRILEFEPETELPAVVTTLYPTPDYIVADVIASQGPYFADSTGTDDATKSLQSAIDACAAMGGGTVYLPAGSYRLTGTVKVPPEVTVRGDRRDPDEGSGSYGTLILCDVTKKTGPVFRLDQNAGLRGLTFYYPHQSLDDPKDLGWTVEYLSSSSGVQGPVVGDLTLINAYNGIGISCAPNESKVTSNVYAFNIKGCALHTFFEVYNNAGASSYEDMHVDGKYWADAGPEFNAPDLMALDAYTRANCTAFILGDLDMPLVSDLSARSVKYGLMTVPGPRSDYWGSAIQNVNFKETDIALYVSHHRDNSGLGVVNSVLQGSEASISMINDKAMVYVAGCTLDSDVVGSAIDLRNENAQIEAYESYTGTSRAAKTDLYVVTKAPYSAPCAPVNSNGDLGQDCTAAIQRALDDAGQNGGGIVYLPAGHYLIEGCLSVPQGVELRGSGSIPMAPGPKGGTTLFLKYGKGTASPMDETAAISLVGDGAGIRYLQFFYPENPFASAGSLIKYPYAIRGSGVRNVYVVDTFFANPCYGIDLADGCDRHYIKRVSGTAAYNLIRIRNSDTGWIETLHDINPGYWTTASRHGIAGPWMSNIFDYYFDFTKANCTLISLENVTHEHVLDVLQYGGRYLVSMTGGSAQLFNVLLDQGGVSCLHLQDAEALCCNVELTGPSSEYTSVSGGKVRIYNIYTVW